MVALAVILAACQISDQDGAAETQPPPPAGGVQTAPALTLLVTPAQLRAGHGALLQWSAPQADSCVASGAWSGARAISGSEPVVPAEGIQNYRLRCSNEGGSTERVAIVQVFPAPGAAPPSSTPPVPPPAGADIDLDFSVTPGEIPLGLSVLLRWRADNAEACVANGDWSGTRPASGESIRTPAGAGSHSYTLRCSGSGAPAIATVTVNVLAPPDEFADALAEFQRLRHLEDLTSPP